MQPNQVVSLLADMETHGVRLWLMGGWGIDALLERQTRAHHDVDVLVDAASLERFRRRPDELGFELRYVWDDEVWWIRDESWSAGEEQPTAFVCGHPDGREIDVHVMRLGELGDVTTLWTSPYSFSVDDLQGHGVVGARQVPCLTSQAQISAHAGYDLPSHHVADLQLLASLGDPPTTPAHG